MTDKERFDSIYKMYKQSWENFNVRRNFEFKLSYALNTVFSIAIAGMIISSDKMPIDIAFFWGVVIIGACLLFLHILWCIQANRPNFTDRKIALHFEHIMQELSNSSFTQEFRTKYLDKYAINKDKCTSILHNWSYLVQIGISFCLYFALVYVTLIKLPNIY